MNLLGTYIIWPLKFDLSNKIRPTSNYATTGIAQSNRTLRKFWNEDLEADTALNSLISADKKYRSHTTNTSGKELRTE
jgi:hypothetical protein